MVILISIDGMRPDALGERTPTIQAMINRGTYSLRAQTVMPCCTLPCHTTMLRGVPPERHGITDNTFHPLVRPVPSVFDVAAQQGLKTGFFYNWGPLRDLCDPESLTVGLYLHDAFRPEGDDRVTDAALRYLSEDPLDFLFVYLGWTDECGHMHGWMSEEYLEAVAHADTCVARILIAHPDAHYLVISDHGGHDRTHGTELPEDMTIPFILSGPGIDHRELPDGVTITDTASTLAKLLNIPAHREWQNGIENVTNH
jgi:predicted AlkP superfamily pyrophosphatase or phosphodiesterase